MQYPRKKSFAAEQLNQQKKKRKSSTIITIAVVAVIIAIAAVGYALYMRFGIKEIPTEAVAPLAEEIKSVAVLAFEDMTSERNMEHVGDGMAESIINALTQIDGLRVPGRTSAFYFKGKEAKIHDIGKELDVEHVLEGSIQQSGDRLRISAQLIRVGDDNHLWSDQYDHFVIDDVFAIQDSISFAIVEALKGELLGNEKVAIEKRPTENTEAYDLYLMGRYFWNKRNEEEFNRALSYFQQACDKDPNYSLAYVGIADTYSLKGYYSFLSPKDAFPIVKAAAEKAIRLDDTLAEAHTSLAFMNLHYDWIWTKAESEFKRALELNPNYADTHHWYSLYLAVMGRSDEAIMEIKRAQKLDPLSVHINAAVGAIFNLARKYDEAIEQLHKTIEMDPNHPPTYWILGLAYSSKEMWEEAIEAYKKFVTLSGGSPLAVGFLGSAYAGSGQKDEALEMLNQLDELSKERYVSPFHRAYIYIALGEMDQAFEYLEKCYVEREHFLAYLKVDSYYDQIRSDPRFKALLKKMGLPED